MDPGLSVHLLGGRILDPSSGVDTVSELVVRDGQIVAQCGGGGTLAVAELELAGEPAGAAALAARFGTAPIPLAAPVNLAPASP